MIHTLMLYVVIFIFSAIFGSFLNVVIYRLPLMLQRQWKNECLEFLQQTAENKTAKFNLLTPPSHCPQCHVGIKWYVNIPLLGYFFSRSQCIHCNKSISLRYPAIELLTALVSCFTVWHFGFNYTALFAILFSWFLIIIIFIDIDHMIIPDQLSLILLWLGLAINTQSWFSTPSSAIGGAIAGYLSLWLVMHSYRLITGKHGMGHGDFKLFAASGSWLGWQLLPLTLLIAAFLGSIIGISLIVAGKHSRSSPLPFGPYLAIASWIALFYGEHINAWYNTLIGLH